MASQREGRRWNRGGRVWVGVNVADDNGVGIEAAEARESRCGVKEDRVGGVEKA